MARESHNSKPRKLPLHVYVEPKALPTSSSLRHPSPPISTLLLFHSSQHTHTQPHSSVSLIIIMASTDESPGPTPAKGSDPTPGEPMSIGQHVVDKGAIMLQSLKPIKQMSQHVCSFAIYSNDMSRQIETHHYCTRLNQDFLQCAVYDSDDSNGRLLGVEYVISDNIFETLPPEEQKLWHSHAYEIKAGLWVNPRVPEMIGMPELENLAKTYEKFWCTWQVDRGTDIT